MADDGDRERMTRIAQHLEHAGVTVRWIDGWGTRGATWPRVPVGLIDHHDASSRKSGEWGSLGAIVHGRRTPTPLSGPLASFQGARCLDGVPKVAVCAAGIGVHAGKGGPAGPVPQNCGNSWLYGDEWANNGTTERYTGAAQYAREALAWAVLQECQPPRLLLLHRTWAPGRKGDPTYELSDHRARVAAFGARLAAHETDPPTDPPTDTLTGLDEEDDMRPDERLWLAETRAVAKATDTRVVTLAQQVAALTKEVQALRNGTAAAPGASIPASR